MVLRVLTGHALGRQKLTLGVVALTTLLLFLLISQFPTLPRVIEVYEARGMKGVIAKAKQNQFLLLISAHSAVEWPAATPESQGIDGRKLNLLRSELAQKDTRAFLVVRNGFIVYEWYSQDTRPTSILHAAALSQSLSGSLALMLAVDSGRIHLDDPAWKYIPQWKGDPERSKITIRHLASETSGLDNVSFLHADTLEGWKRDYHQNPGERFTISLNEAPVIFPPGTQTRHSGPGQQALAYALAASFKDAPESDLYSLLQQHIMEPIGISKDNWRFSYGRSEEIDGLKVYTTGAGSGYTARAMAGIGQFLLNRGSWDGKQLLSLQLVDEATSYANTPIPERVPDNPEPATGLGWRVNTDGVWPSLPRDAYAGGGDGDQVVLVVPSLRLIVVRAGGQLDTPREPDSLAAWGPINQFLFEPIMDSMMVR